MNFLDSSAVVALLISQPGGDAVAKLLESDPAVIVWWGTRVECVSAIHRLQREKVLDEDQTAHSLTALNDLWDHWMEVLPSSEVRVRALELVGRHPLKAADAFQLAAASVVLRHEDPAGAFVCFDRQLAAAARVEGLRVA